MATIHISDIGAARDFAGLLAYIRAGAEVVIKSGSIPIAVLHAPATRSLSMEERIALLPEHSPAIIDEGFARDVEAAAVLYNKSLNLPAWD